MQYTNYINQSIIKVDGYTVGRSYVGQSNDVFGGLVGCKPCHYEVQSTAEKCSAVTA